MFTNSWLLYLISLYSLESISLNIEDTVPWVNFDPDGTDTSGNNAALYPSAIDVALSIKLYETHEVDSTTKTYKYNFDGLVSNVIPTKLDTNKQPSPVTTASEKFLNKNKFLR